jgi:hypothetical protein
MVPAGLVGATLKASLLFAAGKAGPSVISAQAAALTQGALKAMWLTKLKVTAAVLLAVGVAGAGAGTLAIGVFGAEQPSARAAEEPKPPVPAREQQPQRPPTGEARREAPPDRTQENQPTLERKAAGAALEEMKAVFQRNERIWTAEVVEARKALVVAEEKVRRLERRQAAEREKEQAELKATVRQPLLQAEKVLETLQTRLEDFRKLTANNNPGIEGMERQIKQKRLQVEDLREKARAELRELEQRFEKMEDTRTDQLVKARQEVVVAEERIATIERQQVIERESDRARVEAAEARVGRLAGDLPRGAPVDPRVRELESKVERLLREVAELRRELRRQTPRPPAGSPENNEPRP